ncbi:MAG: Peptidase rhomboid domain protein [Gemmatimonadetes bacterium]|nr:Peptidase rhomboid domain protein [Gemmatimonadota bacterium]
MSFPATYEQDQTPKLTPAVQVLLAINVAVAFLQLTLVDDLSGALAFDFSALPGRWWAAATYMFAHVSVWHLVANMYGLYVFGPRLEQAWGAKKFTWFYLLCGFGGVAFEILFLRAGTLVGASAAVFGVMTAYVMQWPDDEVNLLFVVPMRARSLVAGLVVFNLVMGVMATGEGMNIAYVAHVGGMLASYVYVRMTASTGMEQVRQRVANLPDADEPPRAIPRNLPRRERGDEVDDIVAKSKAIAAKRVPSLAPTSRRREGKADELNRVLDKISELGIDSLTTDERKTLEEMSKKLRGT